MAAQFIGLDWGTTSLRAYLADRDGAVLDSVEAPDGIMASAGRFEVVFARHTAHWPEGLPVLASGMIGSRQGWIEAPYCRCPAGLNELARGLVFHDARNGRRVGFMPGVVCEDDDGIPDVMRGEETQVIGAISEQGLFVLPGTHSKWLRAESGKIIRFATFMTGEVFAALKDHTILGRLMVDDAENADAFALGVRRGHAAPESFLHAIFSTRTLGLFERLAPSALASYLSGLVIGTEIGAAHNAFGKVDNVTVLGSPILTRRYMDACALVEVPSIAGPSEAAVKGLARIARAAGLIE